MFDQSVLNPALILLCSVFQTAYIPEKERYHVTKSQLLAMMDTMMGGRAAEELVFGPDKITSGASSDLKVVQMWHGGETVLPA
jgi:hypothetical protein